LPAGYAAHERRLLFDSLRIGIALTGWWWLVIFSAC